MKNILITGKNSYIGTNLETWLSKYPENYEVELISLRDSSWEGRSFSQNDVVYHVAGIAHIKETSENKELYYKINRDLAYEIAKKAKREGVKQFIFLSTMSVYGMETGIIHESTPLEPKSNYGKSKLEAEELIKSLEDDVFKIAIIRPPMVYGKGCKGNYPKLAKLAKITPIFPDINNQRSMIYIDNLSEFVRQLIDNQCRGLFFPQNAKYVNTNEIVRLIAETHGKKIIMIKLFNPLLKLLNVSTVNKVFGDLIYQKEVSGGLEIESNCQKMDYETVSFQESIIQTET